LVFHSLPILFLFTREKKVVTYFTILFPYGIGAILYRITGESNALIVFIHIFEACYAFLLGLFYLLEKVKFFLALKVRSDENILFTKIGPSLGYYLLAVFSILIPAAIFNGTIESDNFTHISIACGIGLIVVSILLWIFAKFRFRALLFLLVGLSLPLVTLERIHIPGKEFITCLIIAIILIIIAFVTLIWKKEILPSIMFILIGSFYLLFGIRVSNLILSLVILGIAGLIGIYLTLACLSKKPIPVI